MNDYVYTKIPIEYVCIYNRILVIVNDNSNIYFKECNSMKVYDSAMMLLNMFKNAMIALANNMVDICNKIINYISSKLNLMGSTIFGNDKCSDNYIRTDVNSIEFN